MQESPTNLIDEEILNHPTTQAFIKALRGGVQAEGNSQEELEEISEQLSKTVTDEIILN
jgi:hypothetical protein